MLSSTSFWQLRRRRRCQVLFNSAFPLDIISGVEWRGVPQWQRGSLIKACQDCILQRTLQRFLTTTAKHGKQQSTSYKSMLGWREARRQAIFSTRAKSSRLLHWVRGAYGHKYPESWSANILPTKITRNKRKKSILNRMLERKDYENWTIRWTSRDQRLQDNSDYHRSNSSLSGDCST